VQDFRWMRAAPLVAEPRCVNSLLA
jgi:hypothetical protein